MVLRAHGMGESGVRFPIGPQIFKLEKMGKNKIDFPLDNCKVIGYRFGQEISGWGIHLGNDCSSKENIPVKSIANGKVVYSALHPGSKEKGNWGNIIIIEHKQFDKNKLFYSLYGHLGKRLKKIGDIVNRDEIIGTVGKAYSTENGW